jgi:uncharacterized phage protein (TIGR01671 family)
MREIKFRAWDKKCEDMLYSDVQTEEYEFRFTENGIEVYGYSDDFTNPMNVELMQFTGLYDKHHKPIYEGDIVSYFDLKHEVLFKNGAFGWMEDGEFYSFSEMAPSVFDEFEVIGNVYENPELLEG